MVYIYQIEYTDLNEPAGNYHWVYVTAEGVTYALLSLEQDHYNLGNIRRIQVPEDKVQTYLDCKQ